MTPTLLGRWQSRLLLFWTVGALVTIPFGFPGFTVLAIATLFGLGWDASYTVLQKFRWDRDWPAALQLLAGIWEGVVLWLVIPWISPYYVSILHYSLMWLVVFIASQSVMRVLFPRWRFFGGRWL